LRALSVFCSASVLFAEPGSASRIEAIRFWSFGDVTRVAIQTVGEYKLASDRIENPIRAYFDLNGLKPPATAHHGIQTIQVGDKRLKQIRLAEITPGRTRIVFDLEVPVEIVSSQLVNPDRLIVEIRPKQTTSGAVAISSPPARTELDHSPAAARITTVQTSDGLVIQQTSITPKPVLPAKARLAATNNTNPASPVTSSKIIGVASPALRDSAGDRSLVRVFGLKLSKVVIDPGHGGHDTGTIGPNGLMEKNLVLDVALRLGKLVTQQLGADVVYTRSDDTFIPLESRTKVANDEKADLFISIHANSSPASTATGVETYFFNLTSDKSGLDLASRENATARSSISDLNDLLHRAVLQTKLEESREFAQKIQSVLWASSVKMNNHSRDRGVRQAPFVVLIGATMPSILAEIGFVSNPHDEKLLGRGEQRQKIADALFKGISQYASSLSHMQMARAASR